ncbi:primary-amine oxidase [Amnibacterium flavum]|uniref:Amine oxidase n=1 Tax=Amnibacterium flavum TaxID=2173173 RepID=A0A2V1HPR2_9MICO|nr:primary-amine oxidase [Amnibacterium flavum]PVZ94586.1 tyramine oxidase [Amnibacterium flavum]
MTLTTSAAAPSTVGRQPLRSLDGSEITAVRDILTEAGLVTDTTRFAYVGLDEPHKDEILSGGTVDRRVRVLLLDVSDGRSLDVRVSLDERSIVSNLELDRSIGEIAILNEEFEVINDILLADDEWRTALGRRDIDPDTVALAPLSAGNLGLEDEKGKRLMRVLAFRQDFPQDHCWAHPIDGLVAYVDLIARSVHKIIDDRLFPVPAEHGNYTDPELTGLPLEGLKPIVISQPEGSSFTIDDGHIEWANWSLDVSFDAREGLVLHRIGYDDHGNVRPIVYRASIAEMVVPYADPSPVRYWQNYFDTGEYLFGRYTNSLQLGCDCVGDITYLDITLADEFGNPRTIENGICIHEEDYGTLWKHTDLFTGEENVRRQRRLVISFFTTVGNYDYGFYWYLYLDGTIECEAKLTGFLFTSAYPEEGSQFATNIAPGLGAPYHQHLFCARLDMAIDGVSNAVDEVDVVRLPISETNPWGNAFTGKATRLETESDAQRVADGAVNRTWHVVSTTSSNRMGGPTGYALIPEGSPTLMADPSSVIASRAAFATKNLWVTAYSPDEKYPAGDFVNQSALGQGLPAYAASDRAVDGEDIVLWHTFGPTHLPRLEDWPIMPVDYAKFTLKPYGFFDRNPTLNVPASSTDHCAVPGDASTEFAGRSEAAHSAIDHAGHAGHDHAGHDHAGHGNAGHGH